MKFRYYITSTMDGCVFGTDNKEIAEDWASSEDAFVVDTETGEWIMADMERHNIKERE